MAIPRIQDYLDYRIFLRDYLCARLPAPKTSEPAWETVAFVREVRRLSAQCDFKTPSYLELVIQGKRNLSSVNAKKVAKALKLAPADVCEFVALVSAERKKASSQRGESLQELIRLRLKRRLLEKNAHHQAVFKALRHWIYLVAFEWLNTRPDAHSGFSVLLKELVFAVSPKLLRQVELKLREWDLISETSAGTLFKKKQAIPFIEELPVELVKLIQSQFYDLTKQALVDLSIDEREIGQAVLALTEAEYRELIFELRQLRKKWIRTIHAKRQESAGERVYLLGMHLIPLTRKIKEMITA